MECCFDHCDNQATIAAVIWYQIETVYPKNEGKWCNYCEKHFENLLEVTHVKITRTAAISQVDA